MPSSRQTGARYTYPPVHYGGGGGGTSLIDLFTGSTPRKLQESAQAHEIELENIRIAAEERAQQHAAEIAKDLAKSSYVIELARKHGVMPEDIANKLAPQLLENAMSRAKIGNDPDVLAANKRGQIAEELTPEVRNRVSLKMDTPQGGTSVMPGPGVNGDFNPVISRGSILQPQTSTVQEQFPMKGPDGKLKMTPIKFMPTGGGAMPGAVRTPDPGMVPTLYNGPLSHPGMQGSIQPPANPQLTMDNYQGQDNRGSDPGLVPGVKPIAPIPANSQGPNGNPSPSFFNRFASGVGDMLTPAPSTMDLFAPRRTQYMNPQAGQDFLSNIGQLSPDVIANLSRILSGSVNFNQ